MGEDVLLMALDQLSYEPDHFNEFLNYIDDRHNYESDETERETLDEPGDGVPWLALEEPDIAM